MEAAATKRPRGRPPLPDEEKRKALTILLDPDQYALVKDHAEAEGMKQSAVVRELLEKGIKSLRRQEKASQKK